MINFICFSIFLLDVRSSSRGKYIQQNIERRKGKKKKKREIIDGDMNERTLYKNINGADTDGYTSSIHRQRRLTGEEKKKKRCDV